VVEASRLNFAFEPASVAFVGATEGKVKWGFVILNNLVSGGYEGEIYPVNPNYETVMDMKCYPSVRDIPGRVDLAVITVPARYVLNAIEDCIAKDVPAAVVISAGFRELGVEGAAMEAEMVAMAESAGMVLVGPNGQGVACPRHLFYSWMPVFYPRSGSVGFICQSGNILNMLIGGILDAGFGVSRAVSSGNEAMLKTEDYIRYMAGDDDTEVIVAYVEGVDDGRRFLELSRTSAANKPVVLLKGGRTSSGMQAARSHTGAMAVSETIFESACRQAGVVLTHTIEETSIAAASFLNRPLPTGRRVGIVTSGGGLGVIAADACSDFGLEVAKLSDETLAKVVELLPDHFVPGNPIDLVAGLDLTILKPVLDIVMRSGEVDSVMFIFVEAERHKGVNIQERGGRGFDMAALWELGMKHFHKALWDLYSLGSESGIPLYVVANVELLLADTAEAFTGDLPMTFDSVEAACASISAMSQYYLYRERMRDSVLV
jgi:acyl-CoA synthetase (NDP forming)